MPRDPERKRPGANGAVLDSNPKQQQRAVNNAPRHGAQAAALVADVAFRRRVQRLWPLGSYVGANLLAELAVKHPGCRADIEAFVDRAVRLEPVIRQLGADQWPELPLRVVR